jgi:WS/DGAT/MGAT family acyltransferase
VVYEGGTATWKEDPHFDLDAHVHRIGLNEPDQKASLEELVSDLMSSPLDLAKPPWQFHLIERYDEGSVLIGRIHHCIGDGIALIQVLISLADEEFDPSRATPSYGKDPSKGSLVGRLLRPVGKAVTSVGRTAGTLAAGSFDFVQHPGKAFDWAKQGMSVGAAVSKIALMANDSETRFKAPAGVMKRAAWSLPTPLDRVKTIGHATGAKVNDVLLAAVAGSLRRYFETHGEPTDGVEVRVAIPVNLRPLEQAFDLGNEFGLVFLALPVGIADARERLLEVKHRMDQVKSSAEPGVVFGILQAIGAGPELMHQQVVEILGAKTSGVVTNVPGPEQRLHFLGNPIRRLMFWVPRAGDIGLGISIISYADEVLIGVATDAKMAPDPRTIVEGFHAELDALLDVFGNASESK